MDNSTKLATVSQVVNDLTSFLTTTANTDNYAIPDDSYGKVALNVYQIYPKKKVYPLSGYTAITGLANQMIVGAGDYTTKVDANLFNISGSLYVGFGGSVINNTILINLEYVDLSGNFVSMNTTLTDAEPEYTITNCINVNSIKMLNSYNPINDIYLTTTQLPVYRNVITRTACGTGIITVPNGYIGIISDIYFYSAVVGDLKMHIRDLSNNIKMVQTYKNMAIFDTRYNSLGQFNYPLYAGDSVYFVGGASNMGNTYVHAIVTLTPI